MPSGDKDQLPPYITLPPATAAVLGEFEGTRFYGALRQGVLAVNCSIVKQLSEFAIPKFYPRELGGGDFPTPKDSIGPSRLRALCFMFAPLSNSQPSLWPSGIPKVWHGIPGGRGSNRVSKIVRSPSCAKKNNAQQRRGQWGSK